MKSTAKNLVVHPSSIPLAGLIRSLISPYSLMIVILHKLLTAPVCMVFQFTRFFLVLSFKSSNCTIKGTCRITHNP